MDNIGTREIVIIAAAALLIIGIAVLLLVRKNHKKNLKKQVDELYVRFTAIRTIPLAFKLNRAQTMAKRSQELSQSVESYARKYEDVEKQINELQEKLNEAEDSLGTLKYKEALKLLEEVSGQIGECEAAVKEIDDYLEDFSKKENDQREYSSRLKEKYRIVKTTINKNSQLLSISYDGFLTKLSDCEELFSASEESMYASDYLLAQEQLEQIDGILEGIKVDANAVPKLIKDTKGVLPVMLDETSRELALTRQRGVYLGHLGIEDRIKTIETEINEDVKKLMNGDTEGIRDNVHDLKARISTINEELAAENESYVAAKQTNDKVYGHISDLEKVENYVRVAYDKDSARFGLQDLRPLLKQMRENIDKYKNEYASIAGDISASSVPSAQLRDQVEKLDEAIDGDLKQLYSFKSQIDKSTDGETRALSQLVKLQLVVSEVETKLAEYSLPAISETYRDDLQRSRDYIDRIRDITLQIPINIELLNSLLEEAIDFIYKFYNNINNVVGMSVMVENAIVFGNKYRSTFPEIDRELNKAEYFLN